MIYFAVIAALIAAFIGFALRARRQNVSALAIDAAAVAVAGLLCGILIGIGACLGMLAISLADGGASRLSVGETIRVIAACAGLGIVLALLYEGVLRRVLRQRGYVFGVLVALFAIYPLANAAAPLLTSEVSTVWLYLAAFGVALLMFVPFGWCLEMFLRRYYLRQLENSGL